MGETGEGVLGMGATGEGVVGADGSVLVGAEVVTNESTFETQYSGVKNG